MRQDIEIFYHPEAPVPIASLQTRVLEQDFSAYCTEKDKEFIEHYWTHEILPMNPRSTSALRGRANLLDTNDKGNELTFEYLEYKQYLATSRTRALHERTLSHGLYGRMRIAAVGAALILPDDTVLVHRRPYTATHVAGVIDCSAAGVLPVDAQGVYIEHGLHEKLKRELGLNPEDVTINGATGVHSAGEPDFSGLITTVLHTPLSREEIEQRMKPGVFPGVRYIPRKKLADFVFEHYTRNNMNHDGAMTLLSSLELGEWYDAVEQLQRAGKSIVQARLVDGQAVFDEEETENI